MSNDVRGRTTTTQQATAETVGQVLMRVREDRRLSLSSVAIKTKIPLWFISALEEGDHERIAEDVYSRIWFKAYCTYLGIDAGRAYAAHQNERRRFSAHFEKKSIERHPKKAVSTSHTMDMPRIIRNVLLASVVLAVAVYFVGSVKRIVSPPAITLVTPTDGFITTQRTLAIEGKTEQEVGLSINGKQIAVDNNGNFKDSIDLQEGVNTITVVGSKKHSKEMIVSRRVIVQPTERPTAFDTVTPPPGT